MAGIAALNGLGLELLKALYSAASPGENVVLSPLSIKTCLSMVAAGATEGSASEKEMATVLGDIAPMEVDKAIESFNSAWVRGSIREDYLAHVTKTYGAEAFPLPHPNPSDINAWVKDRTHGRISELFDDLDPLTVLVLVNTVFFKGTWAKQFDAKMTEKGTFTTADGNALPCDMMRRKDKEIGYVKAELAHAVQLSYTSDLSATVLLPIAPGADGMAELVASLDATSWAHLHDGLQGRSRREIDLTLPRFKLEAGSDLTKTLSALGMPTPFLGEADGAFLRMTDDPLVHIDTVMHKATIEVNEEGTVAAAATGAVMATRCMPPPPMVVKVDRPFIFLITDKAGGIVFASIAAMPQLN